MTSAPPDPAYSKTQMFLSKWVHRRSVPVWLVVVAMLYSLLGFLLAPRVLESSLEDFAAQELGLRLHTRELKINPWSLSLEVLGLQISDTSDATLISFDRLFVNFQTSSLFRWAYTFREITLDGLYVNVVVNADGSLNLLQLIPPGGAPADAEKNESGSEIPRLLITNLNILQGRADFRDASHPTQFSTTAGPIDVALTDLNTLADRAGGQQVSLVAENGTRLEWQGNLALNPFHASGTLQASGDHMKLVTRYFSHLIDARLDQANFSLGLNYVMAANAEGVTADISGISAAIENVSLLQNTPEGIESKIVGLKSIRLENGRFQWPENRFTADALRLMDADLQFWRSADVPINFMAIARPPVVGTAEPADSDGDGRPFSLALDLFSIDNLDADFTDFAISPETSAGLRSLHLSLRNISLEPGAMFPLEVSHSFARGGQHTVKGNLTVLPELQAELDVAADGLPLDSLQPWISPYLNLTLQQGFLDYALRLNTGPAQPLHIEGSAGVRQLNILDSSQGDRLAGWKALDIDMINLDIAANALQVSKIALDAPYGRIIIREDRSTNFDDLIIASDTVAASGETDSGAETGGSAAMEVTIGKISLADASSDFSDLSLPLPFATFITNLNGSISTLSTTSQSPAEIELHGDISGNGLTEVSGALMPLAPTQLLDMRVLFRNVDMSTMSPYTVEFVGHAIDSGRANLDLKYLIRDKQLLGNNRVVIKELKLGDKVDSPNAMNLPLGLAIALLKKPDGTIDLDLDVTGDVNDPSFSVGRLLLSAFGNLITRAVSAPFSLLAGLVGAGEVDIGEILFRPGEAILTAPENDKLLKLQEALALRTELALEISGVISSEADTLAISTGRIEAEIEQRLAADKTSTDMLDQRQKAVVEILVTERLARDLTAIQQDFMRPANAENPQSEQVLDELAYMKSLKALLVAAETVSPRELEELAHERANAIRVALLGSGNTEPARIIITAANKTAEPDDSGWVPLKLDLVPVQ